MGPRMLTLLPSGRLKCTPSPALVRTVVGRAVWVDFVSVGGGVADLGDIPKRESRWVWVTASWPVTPLAAIIEA